MNNLINKSALIILISVLGLNFSNANNPTYKLMTENVNRTALNVFEFDIYLHHTNPDETKFEYIVAQYIFDFNPEIANGGTLTYSILSSDLPLSLQPRNPTISGSQLRLTMNTIPAKENLPAVSDKEPGTLIARMRLETSAKTFSETSLDLKFRVGPENPFTKVMAYIDNQIIDITNSEEVALDNISGVENNTEIPTEFALNQNYPNPFNPSTTIEFDIPLNVKGQKSSVKLIVYDITGKEIVTLVNENLNAGRYEVTFNGSNFASGVYFYRINAGDFVFTKKMFLIK